MKETTIYIVRHGTTDLNKKFCYQGHIDVPLNELGLAQGEKLYDRFKDIKIDVAVSSPLIRAQQTMDKLLGDRKSEIEVQLEDGLMELNGGVAEGHSFPEINVLFPGFTAIFTSKPGKISMPGGESAKDVEKRVSETILRLARENRGKTIVITMHGFAIATWMNFVDGSPIEEMTPVSVENVAVNKYIIDEQDQVRAEYVNDARHLPQELRENYDWEAILKEKVKPLFLCYSKCTTCKKAKKYLDDAGIEYFSRDLVKEHLWPTEIEAILKRHDNPKKMFNTSGKKYRELGLKNEVKNMDEKRIIELLSSDGMLVKRPILITGDKVLTGFKEEEWEALLKEM